MNLQNWLKFHQDLKNVPASTVAERVLEERRLTDFPSPTYHRKAMIRERLTLTAAGSVNFTTQLPANANVLFAGLKLSGAMALTTATKLGLGVSGTPSAFLLTNTTMTDGTKYTGVVAPASATRTTVATTAVLSTVDNSGAAAGSGTGVVDAFVIYEYVQALP